MIAVLFGRCAGAGVGVEPVRGLAVAVDIVLRPVDGDADDAVDVNSC
ncbi:hypothetical protein [Curtobacterium sp. MCJR17_043]|nr:hypothetical protein [Curtobacterium sp. MCJR17_043]WIB35654.1 hypothetical protein DEJ15_16135 [Curtobacterium sp. MCJR17_043]